jgi:cell division protein FtsQ
MQLRKPAALQRRQPRTGSRSARRAPRRSSEARTRFELGRAPRRAPERHIAWGRWFRGAATLALLGAVAYGAAWLYLGDTLRVRHVDIAGTQVVDPYLVADAASLDSDSLLTANLDAAAARIEQLPGVASATIGREWPQGVSIAIEEHQGWGYWQAAGRRVVIDAEGEIHDIARPPASDAPTIIDIAAPADLEGGIDVDADTVRLVARLRSDGVFDELDIQPSGFVFRRDRGLTVVVDDGPDAVFGDSTNYAFKVSTWSALVDQLPAEASLAAEIDLRFGPNVVMR